MSYPILYEQIDNIGTVPNNNGLGVLTDCLECMITEERNGIYELEMKYPASGLHSKELIERRIIKAKPNYTDDPQLFRIYKITKVLNGSFTIYARHISYDLSGYPISNGSANSCVLACDLLQDNANGWTIDTDKEVVADFTIYEPSSIRSWFGGKEGSFLDVFGTGEWKYNNFTCSFLQHRGINRGVTVKYAKNLLSLNQDKDSSNVITAVIAYWKDSQDGTVIISDTKTTSVTLDVPNVYVLDCSSDFQNTPTKAQLNDKALNYINNHETAFAKENIKLDFLQIGQLKDRVDLCDIVTINYEDFGISGTAKCITTTWDVLKDRYDSIEIGEPKTNIADTIISVQKTSQNAITQTQMSGAIDRATALITGNSGGYVVLHDSNNDGQPDELLIMNTPDITTATKVWRWNLSGLGYSDTGYDGNYGLAMTMDGAINCAFLKTGNLVFGGTDGNTEGSLTIKDANGNVIANFNKSGCTVNGNIYAYSFTADAGDNITVDILTKDISVNPLGTISGLFVNRQDIQLPAVCVGGQYSNNGTLLSKSAAIMCNGSNVRTDPTNYALVRQSYSNYSPTSFEQKYCEYSGRLSMGTSSPYAQSYVQSYYNSTDGGVHSTLGLLAGSNSSSSVNSQPHISLSANADNNQYCMAQFSANASNMIQAYIDSSNQYMIFESNSTIKIRLTGNSGNITCVSLTQTSSRKYKKNIDELTEEEAKKILELRPVTYDFKEEEQGINMRGFIAEEVDDVIPELVRHNKDYPTHKYNQEEEENVELETDEISLDYTMIIPYLTKMIQIQQKQIETLEARVKELEERSK